MAQVLQEHSSDGRCFAGYFRRAQRSTPKCSQSAEGRTSTLTPYTIPKCLRRPDTAPGHCLSALATYLWCSQGFPHGIIEEFRMLNGPHTRQGLRLQRAPHTSPEPLGILTAVHTLVNVL